MKTDIKFLEALAFVVVAIPLQWSQHSKVRSPWSHFSSGNWDLLIVGFSDSSRKERAM